MGACELAPCALAGDTIEACLTKEKLDELLALWQRNGAERG
ncbi:MAG: hypothetical protein ACYC6N_20395 [Pirellulaceae bacterium]